MKRIVLLICICLASIQSQSQNKSDFFKTIPILNEDTPEWARLMYSENPNVGEVENLYKQYYKANEFVKTIHTQNHKHWIRLVELLLDRDGFIKQPTREEEDRKYQILKNNYEQQQESKNSWI